MLPGLQKQRSRTVSIDYNVLDDPNVTEQFKHELQLREAMLAFADVYDPIVPIRSKEVRHHLIAARLKRHNKQFVWHRVFEPCKICGSPRVYDVESDVFLCENLCTVKD